MKNLAKMTCWGVAVLWSALSEASAPSIKDPAELVRPLVAVELTVGPNAIKYEDCVEATLLTLTEALSLGDFSAANPTLLSFAQNHDLREASLATRTAWAEFLSGRPEFIYRSPLDQERKTHEVKAMWANVLAFFRTFFPQAMSKVTAEQPLSEQIDGLCAGFGTGFSCQLQHQSLADGKEQDETIIALHGQPYARWVLWQRFEHGVRVSGDTYLESLVTR